MKSFLPWALLMCIAVGAGQRFDNLYRDLHARNVPKTLPQSVDGSPVNVEVYLMPVKISLDSDTGIGKVFGWWFMNWKDERLSWHESCYNNVSKMRIPAKDIWVPDVIHYYGESESADIDVALLSSGMIYYVPMQTYTVQCDVDDYVITKTATCTLKFGSWTRSAKYINLKSKEMDTSAFHEGKWALTNATMEKVDKTYPCCPEIYPSIVYTMHLKDRH